MTRRDPARAPARSQVLAGLSFLIWFSGEFLRANIVVLREVLTPGHGGDPAIVRVPLRSRTELEIASTMSLLSLIPGTLTLDLVGDLDREERDSDDRAADDRAADERDNGGDSPILTVHGMHAPDPQTLRDSVHEMEDRVLAVLRRPPNPDDHATRNDLEETR